MSNYLIHADNTKKKHKYIARVKKNKKYRYFYTKAEYDRYLKGRSGNNTARITSSSKITSTQSNNQSFFSKLSSKLSSIISNGKKSVGKILKKFGKTKVKDLFGNSNYKTDPKEYPDGKGAPKDHKYIAKIKLSNGKFRYFYSRQELAAYYKKNKDKIPKNARNLPLLDEPETPEEAMEEINKHYDPTNYYAPGYSNNCYSCTLAYDMRRRGYDVDAIYDENGDTLENIESCYKDAHFEQTASKGNDLKKELQQKYPEGAHGQICVYWQGGGGHSMAWEIQDGEAVIRDCQSGTVYKNFDKIVPENYISGEVNILRTDDKEISDVMATKVVTDQRASVYEEYSKAGYVLDKSVVEPILDDLERYNEEKGIEVVSSRRRTNT